MFSRVLRIVINTRFSKFYLSFLFISIMGSIVLAFDLPMTGGLTFEAIFIGGSSFFIYYFTSTASVPILRSDVDFFLTSPINDRDKAVSLFIAKYLFVGLSVIDTLLWVTGLSSSLTSQRFELIYYLLFLSLIVSSLSIIGSAYTILRRAIIATPVLFFNILFLVMVFFRTPQFLMNSYSVLAIENIVPLVFAIYLSFYSYSVLKSVSADNLGQIAPTVDTGTFLKMYNKANEEHASFTNVTPRQAMMRFNLTRSHSTLTGKNFSSDSVVRVSQGPTVRFSIITGLLIAAMALIVGFILIHYRLLIFYELVIVIIAIYSLVGIAFTYSMNSLSLERAWLSFTSAPSNLYIRYIIFSRMIKVLLISSPVGVAFVLMHFIFGLQTLGVAYMEFLDAPLLIAPLLVLNVKLGVFQIRDPAFITPQRRARQFLDMGPIAILIIVALASVVSATDVLWISLALLILNVFLLLVRSIWLGVIYRLTETGFI